MKKKKMKGCLVKKHYNFMQDMRQVSQMSSINKQARKEMHRSIKLLVQSSKYIKKNKYIHLHFLI